MTVLSRVVRRAALSRRLVRRAERRRSTARSEQDLSLVARLLRRALRHPDCAASVRRRALEKLGAALSAAGDPGARATASAPQLLPVSPFSGRAVLPAHGAVGAFQSHRRTCSRSRTTRFRWACWGSSKRPWLLARRFGEPTATAAAPRPSSHMCTTSTSRRAVVDRVLAVLHAHVCSAFPHAAHAKRAEWWAHCRPHGTGHQLHFDSDDEGRAGVRNPIVSCALYLTSGIGGPTLVTDQAIGSARLAQRGWATLPHTNRLLMFNGKFLHGVVRVPPRPS